MNYSDQFPEKLSYYLQKDKSPSPDYSGRKEISMINYQKQVPEKRTYSVEEIAAILGIGKNKAYLLIKDAEFKVVRIGNSIRIFKKSFDQWLDDVS